VPVFLCEKTAAVKAPVGILPLAKMNRAVYD
jgi:hypothetical protein